MKGSNKRMGFLFLEHKLVSEKNCKIGFEMEWILTDSSIYAFLELTSHPPLV